MPTALIELLAQAGVFILGIVVKKYAQNVEMNALYLKFIEAMQKQGVISAKLNKSYEDQRQRNRDELDGKR